MGTATPPTSSRGARPWSSSPIIGLLAAWEALAGDSLEDTLRSRFPPHEVENTVASVLVALTAGLLYLIALWELRSWAAAAAVALAFAFATSAFSTASRALWSHGPAILVIAAELAILVRARRGTPRRDRLVPLLGPLFVLAYAVRPPTAVFAVALTGVVAISTLLPWWAGFSVGPRLFTDALPLLVVLALPAVASLRRSGWPARIVVAALLAFSLFTNNRGATRFETQQWNESPANVHQHPERIWDWDDLQFLR